MISVQTIVTDIEATLDAEGSDRYTFDNDYKQAINQSVDWLVSVFNKAFADKKLTEENLQDLIRTVVYQTSLFSRVKLDSQSMNASVWSLLKVNPEPTVYPTNASINVLPNVFDSQFRGDVSYIKSRYSAKRLTTEQWEDMHQNIFEAGNDTLLNDFKQYAYLNYSNYSSTAYTVDAPEIEVSPEIPNQFVGLTFLKYPTPISLITDDIEFPKTLTNLVVQKSLNFISFKQGDQTNLYSVSARDIQTLVQLMV
jgi:hypothetical protein